MKTPLVSVIIPMYNTGASCLELIKTLQESTYKNIEIICIDDGSVDNSFDTIKSYVKNKKNIILKKQKNAGASAARNEGIKIASGDWISFIDSDDLVDKTFIEKLVSAYNDKTILVNVALQYNRISSNASYADFMKTLRQKKKNENLKEYFLYSMLFDGRLYGVITKLFRHDIINENNIRFDASLTFAEDTKFVLDYLNAAIKYYPETATIKSIYEPLYIYNFGTETSTVAKSSLDWKNWKKSYDNLKNWANDSLSLTMRARLCLILCRWRISHALAVARSGISRLEKKKYLNPLELFMSNILVKIRK